MLPEIFLGLDLRYVSVCSLFTVLLTPEVLDPHLRSRIDRLPTARELIADFRILNIDFFPRESHLITFRDPWSFPVLFHPACNNLIREHLEGLAKKVRSFHLIIQTMVEAKYVRLCQYACRSESTLL